MFHQCRYKISANDAVQIFLGVPHATIRLPAFPLPEDYQSFLRSCVELSMENFFFGYARFLSRFVAKPDGIAVEFTNIRQL